MNEAEKKAYREGFTAAQSGHPRSARPYSRHLTINEDPEMGQAFAWGQGWDDAMENVERDTQEA